MFNAIFSLKSICYCAPVALGVFVDYSTRSLYMMAKDAIQQQKE
jgi:hypothetical protein